MCRRATPLGDAHQPRVLHEAEHGDLPAAVDRAAHQPLQGREAPVEPALEARVTGRLVWGKIHGGVRWKTCSRSTSGWIAGTYWIAEAPVPIDATRLPVRS